MGVSPCAMQMASLVCGGGPLCPLGSISAFWLILTPNSLQASANHGDARFSSKVLGIYIQHCPIATQQVASWAIWQAYAAMAARLVGVPKFATAPAASCRQLEGQTLMQIGFLNFVKGQSELCFGGRGMLVVGHPRAHQRR